MQPFQKSLEQTAGGAADSRAGSSLRPSPVAVFGMVLGLVIASCGDGGAVWSDGWLERQAEIYLEDDDQRLRVFRQSLMNPDNLYSRQRIEGYGELDSPWMELPPVNPTSRQLDAYDLDGILVGDTLTLGDEAYPLWNGRTPQSAEAWRELGERIFFEYPLWEEEALGTALADPEVRLNAGLVTSGAGDVPGVVLYRAREEDEGPALGVSCALCHTDVREGVLVVGAARRALDLGLVRSAHALSGEEEPAPEDLERFAQWGPGRADILEDADDDPAAIPDLWGLTNQSHLGQAATLLHLGPIAMAVRQETEMIRAGGELNRPPPEFAMAVAIYIYSLEPPDPAVRAEDADEVRRGAALFAGSCALCHSNGALGGPPVHVARVGTNPGLGAGYSRGTRHYRASPLIRVLESAPYFHDGSLADLNDLFNAGRLETRYTAGARGPGAVNGHIYGMELSFEEQQSILAFLRTL